MSQLTPQDQRQELESQLRVWRILLPVGIGIAVVVFMLWQQYDPRMLEELRWDARAESWVAVAVLFLIARHLAYAWRLRILSDRSFGWMKCIELIFIWEFSSAISPTSLGGSAVALIVLSQERIRAARVAVIVLYTVVLDTAFFIVSLPLFLLWMGPAMIQPGLTSIFSAHGLSATFVMAYVLMASYGLLLFIGLFIRPDVLRRFLYGIARIGWFRRWRAQLKRMGDDIIIASKEMARLRWPFHLQAILATTMAWSFRFFVLSCIIVALEPGLSLDFISQSRLYARLQSMFVIIAFSPTPGGSGFVEYVFTEYLRDLAGNVSLAAAVLWRLLSYYSYLLLGVFIVPAWLQRVMRKT